MLNCAIGIAQARANRANLRSQGLGGHSVEPIRRDHLGVVVEETNQGRGGRRHRPVIETGEIKWRWIG